GLSFPSLCVFAQRRKKNKTLFLSCLSYYPVIFCSFFALKFSPCSYFKPADCFLQDLFRYREDAAFAICVDLADALKKDKMGLAGDTFFVEAQNSLPLCKGIISRKLQLDTDL